MANDYEISRATGKCAVSGRDFKEQEFYYAALFETPEGFERKDFAPEAWSGPPENCFCYWKGRVPTREKKPVTIAIDNSILMNLFSRLEDDSSEMRQKFRFVLVLLLMRKRMLRFERAIRKDDQEYWQVRVVQEQSTQQVLNPHLTEQEIEGLNAQLTAILSGDVAAISELEEEAAPVSAEPTVGEAETAETTEDGAGESETAESETAGSAKARSETAHTMEIDDESASEPAAIDEPQDPSLQAKSDPP